LNDIGGGDPIGRSQIRVPFQDQRKSGIRIGQKHHLRSRGKVFIQHESFAEIVRVFRRFFPRRATGLLALAEFAEHDDVGRDLRAGVLLESVVVGDLV
jgi:hypothetical protein